MESIESLHRTQVQAENEIGIFFPESLPGFNIWHAAPWIHICEFISYFLATVLIESAGDQENLDKIWPLQETHRQSPEKQEDDSNAKAQSLSISCENTSSMLCPKHQQKVIVSCYLLSICFRSCY
jgi:hypothetical protein